MSAAGLRADHLTKILCRHSLEGTKKCFPAKYLLIQLKPGIKVPFPSCPHTFGMYDFRHSHWNICCLGNPMETLPRKYTTSSWPPFVTKSSASPNIFAKEISAASLLCGLESAKKKFRIIELQEGIPRDDFGQRQDLSVENEILFIHTHVVDKRWSLCYSQSQTGSPWDSVHATLKPHCTILSITWVWSRPYESNKGNVAACRWWSMHSRWFQWRCLSMWHNVPAEVSHHAKTVPHVSPT